MGATTNLARRLRQHNAELAGGARATRANSGAWACATTVSGFPEWNSALSFEWHWKHPPRRGSTRLGLEPPPTAQGPPAGVPRGQGRIHARLRERHRALALALAHGKFSGLGLRVEHHALGPSPPAARTSRP